VKYGEQEVNAIQGKQIDTNVLGRHELVYGQ